MQHKYETKWQRSIFWIILITLGICGTVLTYVLLTLRNSMMQASDDKALYMQQSADSALSDLQRYAITLELSSVNLALRKHAAVDQTAVYRMCNQMATYVSTNDMVRSIFLYYPKTGKILGNEGYYSATAYYRLSHALSQEGFDNWIALLNTDQTFLSSELSGEQGLYYLRRAVDNQYPYIMVILISPESFLRACGFFVDDTPQNVSAILLDDSVLFSSNRQMDLVPILQTLPESGVGRVETFDSIAYARASAFRGLRYLSISSHEESFTPLYTALYLCALGIVLSLLVGGLSAFYVSRRNTRPLYKILNRFSGTPASGADEYETLNTHIDQLANAKSKSENKVLEQQLIIESLFLNLIIAGERHSEYELFSTARQYDISLENPYYMVAVFLPRSDVQRTGDTLLKLHKWFSQMGNEALATSADGRFVLLMNLERTAEPQQMEQPLRTMAENVFLTANVAVGIGSCYDGLSFVLDSYAEATAALSRARSDKMGSQVLCYSAASDGIVSRSGQQEVYDRFCDALQQCTYDDALAQLPKLCELYLGACVPQKMWQIHFAAVQNQILNTLYRLRETGASIPEAGNEAAVMACKDVASLRAAVEALLQELTLLDESKRSGRVSGLADRAQKIIKQQIADPMLGLYMLSDMLQVSNSYLSTIFKKQYGVGVVQYINQLRIEQAKELILHTDMSIRDISLSVGYSSDVSFARVFKKYQGVTPGSLRQA